MVSLIDLGLIEQFSFIFPFLLVFAISLGVLTKIKFFEGTVINSIIAFVLAFLVLLSNTAGEIISTAAPWFVLLFIFSTFVITAFMLFGTTEKNFHTLITTDLTVIWTLIIVALVIIISSASHVYFVKGGNLDPSVGADPNDPNLVPFQGKMISPIFHPKILGIILITLISTFAVRLLSGTAPPSVHH